MLNNLFGKKNNDDEESKKIAENMQNLSDQIAALKKQLLERNEQIETLQTQLKDEASKASGAASAATEKVRNLEGALATAGAERQASELILKNAQAQIDKLKQQYTEAQQAATTAASEAASAVAAKVAAAAPTVEGLAIGGTAYVTRVGGHNLRLRNGASLSSTVLDALAPGTQLTLLEGPVAADNHAWWHIRASDGREGWVAGEELRTQPD